MSSVVYLNGEYLPRSEAKLSVDDRGFFFGDGVYEVTYWSNVVIKHKGEMLWVPPAIYQSYCVIGEWRIH